jgi:hypothetical protein
MLRCDRYGFYKKRVGTRSTEFVFLHLVGSAGHVVHSGASGPRNVNALFIMFWWDRCSFYKKRARTRYAELESLHPVGFAGHLMHSGASGP